MKLKCKHLAVTVPKEMFAGCYEIISIFFHFTNGMSELKDKYSIVGDYGKKFFFHVVFTSKNKCSFNEKKTFLDISKKKFESSKFQEGCTLSLCHMIMAKSIKKGAVCACVCILFQK